MIRVTCTDRTVDSLPGMTDTDCVEGNGTTEGEMINYETPLGCFNTWEEAASACERADFDPCTCIKIVKV